MVEGNGVVISKLAKSALRQLRCTVRLHVRLQRMDNHIITIPTATVFLRTRGEIRLVAVTNSNCNTCITEVVHKEVDANKSVHQGQAGETRSTINMDKLA